MIYSLWLFYAADPVYVLYGALAVLPGLIPYVWTRIAAKERVFNAFEWVVVALIVVASAVAVLGIAQGALEL